MLISFVIGIMLARSSIRPLEKVTKKLQDLSLHDLQERLVEEGWPKELEPLVRAYNTMCQRLERSFNRLNQFSADLAHELRTPITNIIGQTEVALSSPRNYPDYQEVLASNLEEFHRLSRMIKELLFLAQAENPQMRLQLAKTDIHFLIKEIIEFYSALAEEKSIAITCDGEATLKIDASLFRHAMTNIISNAINYSYFGSEVTICINQTQDKVTITIRDSGIGVAKEDLPKLLDRFYRADKARQQHKGGSGLGLSIVATIIALHNASITITSELNQGTCVTLVFCNR